MRASIEEELPAIKVGYGRNCHSAAPGCHDHVTRRIDHDAIRVVEPAEIDDRRRRRRGAFE
jgi:hypothetical protein